MGPQTLAVFATLAGLATSVSASETDPFSNRPLVPTRRAGTLYINMATGERTLTRYFEDSTGVAIPEIDAHGTAVLFDYWMSVDENPCWDDAREEGFAWNADATDDATNGVTQPVVGWDYGDMPFDSKITGVVLSTVTLATEDIDSNGDGILDTGIDTVAVYYDALSEGNRTSIAPPTAVVRVESIPGFFGSGTNAYGTVFDYDIVVDFGGEHFELGDSDGLNRGSMWLPGAAAGYDAPHFSTVTIPSCTISPNGTACTTLVSTYDGLADFQYLQYYAKHATNDKVTEDSTFIALGSPSGEIVFTNYTTTYTTSSSVTWGGCLVTSPTIVTCTITVTNTFLIPDHLPAGQGAYESFGIGMLTPGSDLGILDWSVGGCCFWFGGIDCAGFLEQLDDSDPPNTDYNQSWFNFTPYAQQAMGFFSDAPPPDPCNDIDLNADTILDGSDISAFIQLFFAQDPQADLNHDSIIDNGDIATFVNLFLSCVN